MTKTKVSLICIDVIIQLHMRIFVIIFVCEPRHEKTGFFAYAKTKAQISFVVTAKPISAFDSATRIKQFLLYLNPNFRPLACFNDCTGRFVSDLVGNTDFLTSRLIRYVFHFISVYILVYIV